MKLSIKLSAFFLFLALLMVVMVATVSLKGKDIAQSTVLTSIEREAALLIKLIDRELLARYNDTKTFPLSLGSLDEQRLKGLGETAALAKTLNGYVRHDNMYRRMVVFDLEGNVVAANSQNTFGKPLADLSISPAAMRERDWFQRAIQGESLNPEMPNGTFVVGPERNLLENDSNHYDMIFSTVLRDMSGNPLGLWVNVVDFEAIERIVEETYVLLSSEGYNGVELTLLDRQGYVIVDMDPVGQKAANYQRDFTTIGQLNLMERGVEAAKLAVSGFSGANISMHSRKHIQQVTGYAHSNGAYDYPGLSWSAYIRVGVDEAFAASDTLVRNAILFALMFVAFGLALAFYLSRRIVVPMNPSTGAVNLIGQNQAHVPVSKMYSLNEPEPMVASLVDIHAEGERDIIYRAAFSQAAVGIARVSLDGRFLEVNDKMCALMGYDKERILNKSLYEITHPDCRQITKTSIDELITDKTKSFTLEKQYIRSDGEEFWSTTSVSLVCDDQGEPMYLIEVVEDISERKEAEKELLSAKETRDELLRGMKLASNAGGICNWSMDIHTSELKWDEGMFNLYGFSKANALTYEDWRKTIHPDDVDYAENEVRRSLDANTAFNAEFRIVHGFTKEVRWIKAAGDVYHNPNSEQYTLFGINLDITDERTLQKKLEQESKTALKASEAKSRFLATMSHEIRTPMNGVVGMIDLLRESELTKDQQRMTATIRDSSFSLLEIINDILDFSKIESGQMELEYRDTDLLGLIERTLDVFWVTAQESNVVLRIHYDFRLPKQIKMDSVRIRQVLLNLVGNAIKFSYRPDKKAFVTVSTEYLQDSRSLRISISDTGVGMTEAQVDKLFMPFTQADSSTTRKYGGTGLGLSISKSFVELMKGNICVTSEPEIGSDFTVTLPLYHSTSDETLLNNYDFHDYHFVVMIEDEEIYRSCEQIILQCQPKMITREMPTSIDDCRTIVITVNEPFHINDQKLKNIVLDTEVSELAGYVAPQLYYLGIRPFNPSELITALFVLCGFEKPDFTNVDYSLFNTTADDVDDDGIEKDSIVVLCVEDQPTNRMVLERQLTNLGYHYEMTKNGVEALMKWKSGRYPVVLTDCHMPEMDGFALTAEIRRLEAEQQRDKTIIIAITANALAGESENCIQAGMDDYISKPVELVKLKSTLARNVIKMPVNAVSTLPAKLPSTSIALNTELFDFDHLESMIGTCDKKMMNAVLTIFWESLISDMALLEQAISDNDIDQIGVLTHGLKGSSASSGALSLSALFDVMGTSKADISKVKQVLAEVKTMMGGIKEVLTKESDINV
ncbi:hybrid sensor histidine kinase/response regulator [Enterovibrio norvegicus FF-162]|uniref:PAS domain S-box protein n=1 Tax=Enterovibrio norvegicus TaxID=188144 RepID=UPI00031FD2C0|nr:PAS domain S-box protein [Enterovibrio norvegicus]OEE74236.1 hybrid sensor histidine kinase/response regulator [Enterovibrio norvegicus FF-162]